MARTYDEIESTAGFYGPVVYAGFEGEGVQSLLTHFHDLILAIDTEGLGYTPMTAVKYDFRQAKLFAVGVIPPSAKVTGKVLDRSASIATVTGVTAGDETTTSAENTATAGTKSSSPNRDPIDPSKANWAPPSWHTEARAILLNACRRVLGREPTLEELQYCGGVAFNESQYGKASFNKRTDVVFNNWGAVQCYKEGPNCAMGRDSHPSGAGYNVGFRVYATPEEGAMDMVRLILSSRPTVSNILQGGGTVYDTSYAMRRKDPISGRAAYYEENCPEAFKKYGAVVDKSGIDPDRNEATQACAREAVTRNAKKIKSAIDALALANGDPWAMGLGTYDEADANWRERTGGGSVSGDSNASKGWSGDGQANSKTAQTEREKTAGVPLNQTELGKNLQAAQRQAIAEARAALEGMANIPPLRLLVNPKQFGVKGTKITSDGNWTRRGPVIEHWGDEQDVISASGKVAAFYTMEMGLSRVSRQFSQSWRNFYSLYLLYKNNGGIYLRDPFDSSGATRRLTYVGSVYIFYDGILYIGSFNNFSITEGDTSPFSVEYSFEFNVRAAFILDQPDGRYDVSYSPQNMSQDQAKPPLPTSSSADRPPTTSGMVVGNHKTTEEEMADLQRAKATSEKARQEEAEETGENHFRRLAEKGKR